MSLLKTAPPLVKPMLAKLGGEPFDSKDFLFEIKWDGYRALANIQKKKAHLYSRNFQSFDRLYPSLVKELSAISSDALLDGEIVVLDDSGKPSFQLLQNYPAEQKGYLAYMVFDILYLNGKNLCLLPLLERKKILKKVLSKGGHVRYCDHIKKNGIAFYEAANEQGLEGIIAKKTHSLYLPGKRSSDWLKIKTHLRQEAVIGGFTEPKGAREKFGSLILGVYDHAQLTYAGHAGTGFDSHQLEKIHQLLLPLVQKNSPFASAPKFKEPVTWVKPKILCEVKFSEWTDSGLMRQAVFVGIRRDKKSEEVVRESPIDVRKKNVTVKTSDSSPILTHLDKIFWPDEGYTKGDLLDYYSSVSSLLIPYLKERPETLHRYPNGINEEGFYQKNISQIPHWLSTTTIQHEEKKIRYVIVNDESSLLYVVNLGCIELNPFNSRIQSLHSPDYLIFDLDPEGVEFEQVIEVARVFYALLKKLNIPSVCKTSGATGLHIYVPMHARYSFEEVRHFAGLIARLVHRTLPDLTSMERSPKKRQNKIYLDVMQNNFAQTVAAPYSVRPLTGAPVSTPLKWTEVKKGLDPAHFTIKSVLKRFKKVGDLFKAVLGRGVNLRAISQSVLEEAGIHMD